MKELTELVAFLKKGEIVLLTNFYKIENRGKPSKRLLFFDLIHKKKVRTDHEAANALYGTGPSSAYAHLKKRLKQDIFNIILLQDAETKTATPYGQAMFDCRRQLIVGDILLARGAYRSAESLLQSASDIAERFELIAEQIMLKDLLRTRIGFKKGIKEYRHYTEDIENLLSLLTDVLRAKDRSNAIGLTNMFSKNKEHSFLSFAKLSTDELSIIYSRTGSPQIGFLYYKTASFYHQITKDYHAAHKAANELLTLVNKEQSIYSQPREADAYLQLSAIYLNLGNNEEAMKSAKNAAKLFDTKKVNYLLALEMIFMSCINDTIDKAEHAVKNALRHSQLKSNVFMSAKWAYYNANVYFQKSDFHNALDILSRSNELMKDSSGWLLGYKLLELLSLIETSNYDLAGYRLKAFSQLLYRQKLNNIVRYKTIFKVLTELQNSDFDFIKTGRQRKAELLLLSEGRDNHYYDPVGFEIIRFDKWFWSKAAREEIIMS